MTAVKQLLKELQEKFPKQMADMYDSNQLLLEAIALKAKEMEKERTSKLCYGVWRAVKTGANYIYISKDSSILGFVEPLSEEDRLKIDVELFIKLD